MEQPIKITPEMRAFNETLERFDNVTDYLFERLTLAELYSLTLVLHPCFADVLREAIQAAQRANANISHSAGNAATAAERTK